MKGAKAYRIIANVLAALVLIQAGTSTSSASDESTNAAPKTSKAASNELISSKSRKTAPGLILTDIAGKRLDLSDFRGRVILLDFWAVDCGGCVIEIPWYVEFDKKFHDRGLQVVGIDMYSETPSMINRFMQKRQMQYPVALGNDDIRRRFHANELPKTMLIDRQGRVAVSHTGIVDRAQFEHDIEELLN
jgi:peroxiredoxin